MRCGRGRVLRFRSDADRGIPLRQGNDVLLAQGVFDLREVCLVHGEHLILWHAVLLELADHAPVVRRLVALLGRVDSRERVELISRLQVRRHRVTHDVARICVDAKAFQIVGVDLRRQPIGLARMRQDRGSHPVVMCLQLARECVEILLPSLEPALLQQLSHAADVRRTIVEVLLHLVFPRPRESVV